MVIVPTDEAMRLGYMQVGEEELTNTVTTTISTDGIGWNLNLSSGMQIGEWCFEEDKIYHDKVSKSLGITHYAKNGKLYRK